MMDVDDMDSDSGLTVARVNGRGNGSNGSSAGANGGVGGSGRSSNKTPPAFLIKLHKMVDDHSTDELIRWSDTGDSFVVPSAERFGREILPRFFKHSNFGSFVRQLNMYGFHKVPHLQQGVLKADPNDATELLEFSNPHFKRGQGDLLHLIHRKKTLPPEEREGSGFDINTVLSDISSIRQHQSAISSALKELQTSNNDLWRESLASRERHKRHQDTINKILRFLASIFGGKMLSGDERDVLAMAGMEGLDHSMGMQQDDGRRGDSESRFADGSSVPMSMQRQRQRLLLEDADRRGEALAKKAKESSTQSVIQEILSPSEDIDHLPTISSAGYSTLSRPVERSSAMDGGGIFDFDHDKADLATGRLTSVPPSPPNHAMEATESPSASTSNPTPGGSQNRTNGLVEDPIAALFRTFSSSGSTPGFPSFANAFPTSTSLMSSATAPSYSTPSQPSPNRNLITGPELPSSASSVTLAEPISFTSQSAGNPAASGHLTPSTEALLSSLEYFSAAPTSYPITDSIDPDPANLAKVNQQTGRLATQVQQVEGEMNRVNRDIEQLIHNMPPDVKAAWEGLQQHHGQQHAEAAASEGHPLMPSVSKSNHAQSNDRPVPEKQPSRMSTSNGQTDPGASGRYLPNNLPNNDLVDWDSFIGGDGASEQSPATNYLFNDDPSTSRRFTAIPDPPAPAVKSGGNGYYTNGPTSGGLERTEIPSFSNDDEDDLDFDDDDGKLDGTHDDAARSTRSNSVLSVSASGSLDDGGQLGSSAGNGENRRGKKRKSDMGADGEQDNPNKMTRRSSTRKQASSKS